MDGGGRLGSSSTPTAPVWPSRPITARDCASDAVRAAWICSRVDCSPALCLAARTKLSRLSAGACSARTTWKYLKEMMKERDEADEEEEEEELMLVKEKDKGDGR